MNIQDARFKAESVTRNICDDLDYDLKVEEKTSLLSKDIIAGDGVKNEIESRLARAIMHEEKTEALIQELTDNITDCIKSYVRVEIETV